MLKKILKEIDTRPELLFRGKANVKKISKLTKIRETSLRSYFRGGKGLGYENLQVLCKYLGLELVKTK